MNVIDELRELENFFEDEDQKESKQTGAVSRLCLRFVCQCIISASSRR